MKLAEFYMKTGEKQKSMDTLLIAEKISPGNSAILFPKATLLSELGKYEEADKILEGLLKQFPEQLELMLTRS